MAKTYTTDISQVVVQTNPYVPENRKDASPNYAPITEPFTVPATPDAEGRYRIILDYAINGAANVEITCDGEILTNAVYGKTLTNAQVGIGYEGLPILEFTEAHAGHEGSVNYKPLGSVRDAGWENKIEKAIEVAVVGNTGVNQAVQDYVTTELEEKADTIHTHPQSDIESLEYDLLGKASVEVVSDLEDVVLTKADAEHTHPFSDITGAPVTTDGTDTTIAGDTVIIPGNLTVQGDQTILNTQTLEIEDNTIELNRGTDGVPSLDSGIVIKRGDEADAKLIFDETNDRWTMDQGNEVSLPIASEDFVTTQIGQTAPANHTHSVDAITGVLPPSKGGTGKSIMGLPGQTLIVNSNANGFDWGSGGSGGTGTQGAQGPQGFTGSTGPQGPQGFTGSTGPQGPQGSQGFTGFSGTQGPQGAQGPIGIGTTGAQGPQGVSGNTGPQGPAGVSGGAAIFNYAKTTSAPTINPGEMRYDYLGGVLKFHATDANGRSAEPYATFLFRFPGRVSILVKNPVTGASVVLQTSAAPTRTSNVYTVPVTVVGSDSLGTTTNAEATFDHIEGAPGVQGPTGLTGPQGAQGPQGVGVTTRLYNYTEYPEMDWPVIESGDMVYHPIHNKVRISLKDANGASNLHMLRIAAYIREEGAFQLVNPIPGYGEAVIRPSSANPVYVAANGNNAGYYEFPLSDGIAGSIIVGQIELGLQTTGKAGETGPQGTSGPQGSSGPQGPQGPQGPGINSMGDWHPDEFYATNDLVTANGVAYIATGSSQDVHPTVGYPYWTIFADRGAPGPQGDSGPQGPAGPQGTVSSIFNIPGLMLEEQTLEEDPFLMWNASDQAFRNVNLYLPSVSGLPEELDKKITGTIAGVNRWENVGGLLQGKNSSDQNTIGLSSETGVITADTFDGVATNASSLFGYTVPPDQGGTGLTTLGNPGDALVVNTAGTGYEFGAPAGGGGGGGVALPAWMDGIYPAAGDCDISKFASNIGSAGINYAHYSSMLLTPFIPPEDMTVYRLWYYVRSLNTTPATYVASPKFALYGADPITGYISKIAGDFSFAVTGGQSWNLGWKSATLNGTTGMQLTGGQKYYMGLVNSTSGTNGNNGSTILGISLGFGYHLAELSGIDPTKNPYIGSAISVSGSLPYSFSPTNNSGGHFLFFLDTNP